MENRSHAIFAGIFVIALVIAGIVAAFWIDRKDVIYTPYKIVSTYPVGGLSMQSDVRYMGVNVGKVLDVGINPQEPGTISITIGLNPGTPVTQKTWAEVMTQGVTGISNIELRDDGGDKTLVTSQYGDLYVIPSRPGFFQQLQRLGDVTIKDIDRLIDQLEKVMTDQNVKSFSESLANTASLTASLNRVVTKLEPTFNKFPTLADSIEAVAKQISQLAKDANKTIALLNAPYGPMQQASKSLELVQQVAAQLQASTLPEINQLADALRDAAQAFAQTARDLKQSPQSILYGAPKVMPGPGEAGFAGFK